MSVKPAVERPVFGLRDPDERGYYGPFGGSFVPETLVAPIDELKRAYFRVREDAGFLAELDDLLANYVGRPTPLYEAKRLARKPDGARDLPEARRPHAHRRAQDQQRARAGAAGPSHGQATHRRRDGRRTARRRDGDGLRAARPRMRRLHGRRGHGAPGAERAAHAAARRRRSARWMPAAARSRTRSTRRCATG